MGLFDRLQRSLCPVAQVTSGVERVREETWRGESRKPLGRYPKASSQEADGTVGSPHITRPRQPVSNEDAAGGHDEYAGDAQQRALRRAARIGRLSGGGTADICGRRLTR